MTDIYEQHHAAFAQTTAYVITNNKGDRLAKVAFKFPKDGAGRLYCYFHLIGIAMVRGHANGYGYDKKSAAVVNAMSKMRADDGCDPGNKKLMHTLQSYSGEMNSGNWDNVLRNAGYNVLQAV